MNTKTKALIEEAVNAGLQAGRAQASSTAKDAFKATERRLYALPVLEKKVIADRERLAEMRENGVRWQSKSVARFQRTGYRVTPEEMFEAVVQDLEATIAADENEIEIIEKALKIIDDDPYKNIVGYRYFEGKNDDEIAGLMGCDPATVWRNKCRLVERLAVFLYGSAAVV